MTSRASGRSAVARANAAIRSGRRRRLKSDPTKSTRRSRRRARRADAFLRRVASRRAAITRTRSWRTADVFQSPPRELRIGQDHLRRAAAARMASTRRRTPFARPEPLRVRDERDVVNRHRQRHAEPKRRRVGRRERRRRAGRARPRGASAVCSHQVPRPARDDPSAPQAPLRETTGSGPASTERTAVTPHRSRRPAPHQLAKVAADTGGIAEQLARIDADPNRRAHAPAPALAQRCRIGVVQPLGAPAQLNCARPRARPLPPCRRRNAASSSTRSNRRRQRREHRLVPTRIPARQRLPGARHGSRRRPGPRWSSPRAPGCRIPRRATAARASTLRGRAAGAPHPSHSPGQRRAVTAFAGTRAPLNRSVPIPPARRPAQDRGMPVRSQQAYAYARAAGEGSCVVPACRRTGSGRRYRLLAGAASRVHPAGRP